MSIKVKFFLSFLKISNSLKPSKDLYKERRSTISMQIQISDLLQLNIESNLQQNLEGSTILECIYAQSWCIVPSFSSGMNLHYFEPMAGWFPALSKTPHLCTIGVKTGPDWKLKRRFLFSDVFSAKWRPLRFFHQRCTDLNSPSPIISMFSPFWSF